MLLGYVRVSLPEQAKPDRTSLQEQERVIRGMAMSMGIGQYDLHIYADPGVSAGIPLSKRPAGGDLFKAAKQGDTVVAAKLDRLFRDALDAQFVYKEFKERGVDLILYDMGNEPVTRDGMSKFFFSMLSAFADLERSRIAERMKEGKKAKMANGGYVGGRAPYGFRVVGEGRTARIEPEPQEQQVVAAVHGMSGKPYAWIAHKLTAQGLVTRSGEPFIGFQVKRILEAPHAAVQG